MAKTSFLTYSVKSRRSTRLEKIRFVMGPRRRVPFQSPAAREKRQKKSRQQSPQSVAATCLRGMKKSFVTVPCPDYCLTKGGNPSLFTWLLLLRVRLTCHRNNLSSPTDGLFLPGKGEKRERTEAAALPSPLCHSPFPHFTTTLLASSFGFSAMSLSLSPPLSISFSLLFFSDFFFGGSCKKRRRRRRRRRKGGKELCQRQAWEGGGGGSGSGGEFANNIKSTRMSEK